MTKITKTKKENTAPLRSSVWWCCWMKQAFPMSIKHC